MRPRALFMPVLLAGSLGTGAVPAALAHDEITVVSWGGVYTKSQMLAFVNPYAERTGTRFDVLDYNGGLKQIRAQVVSYNVKWDLVDMLRPDLIRGCQQGLLETIDTSILPPAPDGTPAEDDFLPGALQECGIGQNVWALTYAYDVRRFPDRAPARIADFFDVKRFPGTRALQKTPRGNLEWALMADGVPAAQVYETLSTQAGLERALRVLDRIKPHLIWWEQPTDAPEMLADGRAAMASGYNGRLQYAISEENRPLKIVWDGQVWDIEFWGIPKRSRHKQEVLEFLKFATDTQRLADQASYVAYGPARRSSLALVPDKMKPFLPTARAHMDNALQVDVRWWAEHEADVNKRFLAWLEEPAISPRRETQIGHP